MSGADCECMQGAIPGALIGFNGCGEIQACDACDRCRTDEDAAHAVASAANELPTKAFHRAVMKNARWFIKREEILGDTAADELEQQLRGVRKRELLSAAAAAYGLAFDLNALGPPHDGEPCRAAFRTAAKLLRDAIHDPKVADVVADRATCTEEYSTADLLSHEREALEVLRDDL